MIFVLDKMITTIVIAILSGIGLGISLFFGIYLLKIKTVQNTILGALLIILTLRITKSVFYNFIELPTFIKNLGLAANLAVGPLLYLYGRSIFLETKTRFKSFAIHIVPSLCYVLFCNYIPNSVENDFWNVSYSFILIHSFAYVIASIFVSQKKEVLVNKKTKEWYYLLVSALSIIWMVYALIFIEVIPVYSAGTLTFSILIFIISFLAIDRKRIFDTNYQEKYTNSNITFEEGRIQLEKIIKLIEEENLYLEPNLTLASLSPKLNLSSRDISLVINRHTNKNFSRFINQYRIEKAKELLCGSDPNTKIIAIALDSGFNSLSAFNAAFKSFTNSTPSEFRIKYATQVTS